MINKRFKIFENEPICVSNCEEGNWIYLIEKNEFKMVILVDIYMAEVDISISYKENIVYSGEYKKVSEINKSDANTIRVMFSDNNSLLLKKENN